MDQENKPKNNIRRLGTIGSSKPVSEAIPGMQEKKLEMDDVKLVPVKSNHMKLYGGLVASLLLLLGIGGGIWFLIDRNKDDDSMTATQNTQQESPELALKEEPQATTPVIAGLDLTTTTASTDITNQILSSISTECADYTGTYTSAITDVSTGTDFNGSLVISSSGATCTFATNQIPNHDVGQDSRFATDISENQITLEVPVSPSIAGSTTALTMGASGIMLNGVKWEAYPAACFSIGTQPDGQEAVGCGQENIENPWRYNIGSPLNNFGFDTNDAHVQPGGLYHYHSKPTALYDTACSGKAESPVVGFAADGFPIYGPCFSDSTGVIREAISSYSLKSGERQPVANYTTPYVTGNVKSSSYDGQFIGDHEFVEGRGDLDVCNGMTIDGQYGYRITADYPYVMACISGTANTSFR